VVLKQDFFDSFIVMKRGLALLMLLLFSLNILGYYGVFMGVRFHTVQKIRKGFDADNYVSSFEVTIKIPLALPYAQDMHEYERVDGEFNYRGDVYRLVKQKLASDTLTIVCVKDAQSKKIDKALEDYVKTFSDNRSADKSQSKSSMSKDFFSTIITLEKKQFGWEYSILWPDLRPLKVLSFSNSIAQPPRA
jgi:hypothetical protein